MVKIVHIYLLFVACFVVLVCGSLIQDRPSHAVRPSWDKSKPVTSSYVASLFSSCYTSLKAAIGFGDDQQQIQQKLTRVQDHMSKCIESRSPSTQIKSTELGDQYENNQQLISEHEEQNEFVEKIVHQGLNEVLSRELKRQVANIDDEEQDEQEDDQKKKVELRKSLEEAILEHQLAETENS